MSKFNKRAARREARKRQERTKKIRDGLIIAAILIVLGYQVFRSNQPAEPLASADVINTGKEVYYATCASCHGEQGEGHVAIAEAPALNGSEHSWHHADGQIQSLIQEGGTIMPAFGDQLDNDEIFAVIRYIQSQWTAKQLTSQQSKSQSNPFRQ